MNIKGQGPRLLRSNILNICGLKTLPIEARFYREPQWDRELNGLGHMTNMASMPIYSKNFKKSSSLKTKGQ